MENLNKLKIAALVILLLSSCNNTSEFTETSVQPKIKEEKQDQVKEESMIKAATTVIKKLSEKIIAKAESKIKVAKKVIRQLEIAVKKLSAKLQYAEDMEELEDILEDIGITGFNKETNNSDFKNKAINEFYKNKLYYMYSRASEMGYGAEIDIKLKIKYMKKFFRMHHIAQENPIDTNKYIRIINRFNKEIRRFEKENLYPATNSDDSSATQYKKNSNLLELKKKLLKEAVKYHLISKDDARSNLISESRKISAETKVEDISNQDS